MDLNWQIADDIPPLNVAMVQVWRIRLDGPTRMQMLEAAYGLLDEEERQRAAAMRSLSRREEFVAGRWALRRLLGSVLGVDAKMLAFEIGQHGKPRLKREIYGDSGVDGISAISGSHVEFNVAHSGGMVLIALSRAGAVGVDVERINPQIEALEVARTALAPRDVEKIETAPEPLAEFYRCWTRQEAIGKADGRGLLRPPGDEGGYFVREIEAGIGFAAAVATARVVASWAFLDWSFMG
jgi:4'-phosphopantetheinyl transferase